MARGDDLGTPRGTPGGPVYDPDTVGRLAERLARYLGTGRYLAAQTFIVIIWITMNVVAGANGLWDRYPFILLNLAFSTQAAYAAPLILLAQNRQDDRDRANIDRDREVAARTQADAEFLARELSAVRLALADVVTTEDLDESLTRLARMIADGQLRPNGPAEQYPAASADRVTSPGAPPTSNYRASTPPSSHHQGEAD